MKILGLIASPRRLGNCEIIVSEMLRSLPDTCQKEMIRLPALKINDCKACYACLPSEKGCIIKDDLDFFLQRIKQADCIIIASPCYFLGAHTSIKKICDRLISILNNASEFTGKKCVTVITYGVPGWDGYAREMLMSFSRFLHLDHQGDMLIQAANPGEAATDVILDQANALAQRLLCTSRQEQNSTDLQLCLQCGSSLWQISNQGILRCPLCDGKHRYSSEGMSEHGKLLESIKERYLSNRHELMQTRKLYEQPNWWLEPKRQE